MFLLSATGSTHELKRELAAFEDKVTRMDHSLQQVRIWLQPESFIFIVINIVFVTNITVLNIYARPATQNGLPCGQELHLLFLFTWF